MRILAIIKYNRGIKYMSENNTKQENSNAEDYLINKCANLERKLYHHFVKSIGGVIVVALICGALGLFFGYFISQTEIASEWKGNLGMFIIMAVFIVLGVIYPIIGCVFKIKQNKLIAKIKNKAKLDTELEKVRAQEKEKWNSSTSYGSNLYSSSSYSSKHSSSSDTSSSNASNTSSSSSYDIYDNYGNKTGSVENKGLGRINDVYDENGVVKGWALDNGGDTMDYYNNDGSYGGTIKKK